MKQLQELVRPNIWALQPYSCARDEFQGEASVYLDANENPFNAPINRYPDPLAKNLRAIVADAHGVLSENVLVGNGGDELLFDLFLAYGGPGRRCLNFPPTFSVYASDARITNTEVVDIPRIGEDSRIDMDATLARLSQGDIDIVVLTSPNNPTGNAVPREDVDRILDATDALVLVDEAYVDFSSFSSLIPLTKEFDNLLVIQTFSKSRSMAGARLGFGAACPALIADLNTLRYSTNPYNVNSMTLALGLGTVLDEETTQRNCAEIIRVREQTTRALRALGFEVLDSKANFVFARSGKIGGETLYRRLKERGILVRHFNKERIADWNRITIGTKVQMDIFLEKVEEVFQEKDAEAKE